MHAAAHNGIEVIALTDHDTVAGFKEAQAAANELSIRCIAGIELDMGWNYGEFHVLGLGVNPQNRFLSEFLQHVQLKREERNMHIIERMHAVGIAGEYADIQAISGGHSVGRPHFAAFLVSQKKAAHYNQAFERYLANGKPLYVPKEPLCVERAIYALHEAGALAVLAHPLSLYLSWKRLKETVQRLKEQGLDGIESWHPTATEHAARRLEALAQEIGVYSSAGSDFHGVNRPSRSLGKSAGGRIIERSMITIPL
ncbi:putative 3',5'-nucleoside bisphosphate phosphatase [Pillotina sp. SPG140]|jgi:predicted metal-dependent phosphoesterase TrpH